MKKCIRQSFLLTGLLIITTAIQGQQEKKKCCDHAACRDKTVEYAKVISGLVNYAGNCTGDATADSIAIGKLRIEKPGVYDDLIRMVSFLDDYIFKDGARFGGTECFEDALPEGNKRLVMCWINYVRFNILHSRPKFPSTEFCGGWNNRIELGQGASAFLSKSQMAYLGSVRAYLIYTFFKKNKCGGRFRILAGPALFLRSRNAYITLGSRVGYKLTDLKANVFSLGNLNLFGGYNSNFNNFNYAEVGLEVELGPFGINLAANSNTDNGKMGFLVGIFFGSKKKISSKIKLMKVLITSGGGAKGAFSVGVLRYLKRELNVDHFDIISGTSTGALIASLAAVGKIDQLAEVYRNTTNADILAPRNVLNSITMGDPFIFGTEPLLQQVEKHIDDAVFNDIMNSDTILYLNSVSLQTGRLTVFSTKELLPGSQYTSKKINTRQQLIAALLASSNQAVFTDPVSIDNEQFVDGGNREVIPTRVVCNNLPLDKDHEIYILSNNPNELVTFPGKKYTSILDVLMRAIAIFIQEIRENDLELMAKFKTLSTANVKIFYLCPTRELDKEFPTGLRFDKGLMLEWMLEGEELAREIIETTPGGNFPEFHLSNRSFA